MPAKTATSATKAKKTAAETQARPSAKPRPTKIGTLIALLERDKGATLAQLTKATGWQGQSVRAALTGLKKKGHEIVRSKRDGLSVYRVKVSS